MCFYHIDCRRTYMQMLYVLEPNVLRQNLCIQIWYSEWCMSVLQSAKFDQMVYICVCIVYIVCTLMMVIKFVQIFAFLHYNCCFRERPAKGYPIDPIQIYIHLNFYLYSYLKWRLTFSHVLVFFWIFYWDMGKIEIWAKCQAEKSCS